MILIERDLQHIQERTSSRDSDILHYMDDDVEQNAGSIRDLLHHNSITWLVGWYLSGFWFTIRIEAPSISFTTPYSSNPSSIQLDKHTVTGSQLRLASS